MKYEYRYFLTLKDRPLDSCGLMEWLNIIGNEGWAVFSLTANEFSQHIAWARREKAE